jgi:Mn2+/Fe2+ NRAMP family transporter
LVLKPCHQSSCRPAFYTSYGLVVGIGAAIVLIPGLPLIGILFVTQVVNAVLLLPLLLTMILLGRDPSVLGRYRNRRPGTALACAASALVVVSLVALVLSAAA